MTGASSGKRVRLIAPLLVLMVILMSSIILNVVFLTAPFEEFVHEKGDVAHGAGVFGFL